MARDQLFSRAKSVFRALRESSSSENPYRSSCKADGPTRKPGRSQTDRDQAGLGCVRPLDGRAAARTAVPLPWALEADRPVTLRPRLSTGLPCTDAPEADASTGAKKRLLVLRAHRARHTHPIIDAAASLVTAIDCLQ